MPNNAIGITSTGPMPPDLGKALLEKGLGGLVEIYGSSETAAIGWRHSGDEHYCLIDVWKRDASADDRLMRSRGNAAATPVELMDNLVWHDDTHFSLEGRIDGAVQVGGYNVFPERVREVLLRRPELSDAAVRLDRQSGRLKAFLVPSGEDVDEENLISAIDGWCAETLSNAERPRDFTVGKALPRTEMGKLRDW